MKLYEPVKNNTFMVTKDENNELVVGFYHDILTKHTTMRVFEGLGKLSDFTTDEIMEMINAAGLV